MSERSDSASHSSAENGSHPEKPGRVRREIEDGPWFDPDTGITGYGKTYGERSFNNRPIRAIPADEAYRSAGRKVPFTPFDAPRPKPKP